MNGTQRFVWLVAAVCSLAVNAGCGGGGPADEIVRVSRQNNSGTYAYFREVVLGEDREFALGSIDLSGSKDVVDLVAKTPNAIGYSGMGYATDEVKMLSLSKDGGPAIPPTAENASSGTYPLARGLYVYTIGEPQGAQKHFLDWCLSPEGQAIVQEIGYVSTGSTPMDDSTPPPDATIKVQGSDTMVNLSQAWAEEYMKKYENVNIQVSGGGSGTGIKALIDGTVDMANASREMKEEEKQQVADKGQGEAIETTMALDALAVYVHKDNPINEISLKDLAEIYGEGGTLKTWSQLKGE